MKKEPVFLSLSFLFAVCAVAGAITLSGEIWGLVQGVCGAFLGSVFFYFGIRGILSNIFLQQTQHNESLVKAIADLQHSNESHAVQLQNMQKELSDSITVQVNHANAAVLESLASAHKEDLECQNRLIASVKELQTKVETLNEDSRSEAAELFGDIKGLLTDPYSEDNSGLLAKISESICEMHARMEKMNVDSRDMLTEHFSDIKRLLEDPDAEKPSSMLAKIAGSIDALQEKIKCINDDSMDELCTSLKDIENLLIDPYSADESNLLTRIASSVEEISKRIPRIVSASLNDIKKTVSNQGEKLGSLNNTLSNYLSEYQSYIQKYSELSEQDAQLLSKLVGQTNE